MDSKLPKPSGLKQPTPVSKNILPMDRIKPSTLGGFGASSSKMSASVSFLNATQPLTRDLSNLTNGPLRSTRAASPEIARKNVVLSRTKMRRSRSAVDLRQMQTTKRPEPTLSPIPSKKRRLAVTGAAVPRNNGIPAANRLPRIGSGALSAASSTSAAVTSKRPVTKAPLSRSTANKAPSQQPAATVGKYPSTSTSVSTTGSGKPINKRIPPYDFKARYNDLLEKFKVLKGKHEEKCEQMSTFENLPEQLEEAQTQLMATTDHLQAVQAARESLQKQVDSQAMKIDSISKCFGKAKEELKQLKEDHEGLKFEHNELRSEVLELRDRSASLASENAKLIEEIAQCKEQLFESNIERKELHNTVMDLRGNIRVFCRVRPPLEEESDKMLCGWNYIDEATVEIQSNDSINKNKAGSHVFSFDHVFHSNCRQEDIFEMVSPLIQSALDGYNICIFAYGQTGSGKTYTMDGNGSNPGVIPRTVDLLFQSIKNYKRLGWEYKINATFLEIYNEVLYDLLSNEQKEMEIRMAKNNKNDIYVSNITEQTVETAEQLRQLMAIAKMNRATAATVGNERSSRSHAVTKIELVGSHAEKSEVSIGTINLVDLAGSESPKTSIRMNETKNINRSLSELTNVILALLQKQDHIPYRNSKLTHLLMPSLGGNSKTLMFINVAPFNDCFNESVKSLRFAASVNSCKVSKAKRNRYLNTSISGQNMYDK